MAEAMIAPSCFALNYSMVVGSGTYSGAFSMYKEAINNQTREPVKVKIISRRRLALMNLENVDRELEICRTLSHDNILKFYEYIREVDYYYLLFEPTLPGNLLTDLFKEKYYSETDAAHLMKQIMAAINYCHHYYTVYSNLRVESFLFTRRGYDPVIKLHDFELSFETDGAPRPARPEFETLNNVDAYYAPEILERQWYTKPADIWACGVILYSLLIGYPPFSERRWNNLISQIKRGNYIDGFVPEFGHLSEEVKDLIREMLRVDVPERITAAHALSHPWFDLKVRGAKFDPEDLPDYERDNFKHRLMNFAPLLVKKEPTAASVPIERVDTDPATEILELTEQLMQAIDDGDFEEYAELCDTTQITAFKPETFGFLVKGVDFDKINFVNLFGRISSKTVILREEVNFPASDVAYITYIRSMRYLDTNRERQSYSFEETRIWKKKDGRWKNIHSHTSARPAPLDQ